MRSVFHLTRFQSGVLTYDKRECHHFGMKRPGSCAVKWCKKLPYLATHWCMKQQPSVY